VTGSGAARSHKQRPDADPRAAAGAIPRPWQEDELIEHLERDQLAAETMKPVPRAHIGSRAAAALWALRVFVVVVGAMVIYTFVAELH
jgi:hypothetical protein